MAQIDYISKNKEINDLKMKKEDIRYHDANDRFTLKRNGQYYCPEMVCNNSNGSIDIDYP